MDFFKSRPAGGAAAGFVIVSFLGYFAAADADPETAGAVRIIAAVLFFAAGAIFIALRTARRRREGATERPVDTEKTAVSPHGDLTDAAPNIGRERAQYNARAALCIACGVAALLSQLYFGWSAQALDKYCDGAARAVTFTVLELERVSAYDASYLVEVTGIDGEPPGFMGKFKAELDADYVLDLNLYSVYTLDGVTCSRPEPADSSEAAYKASRGVRLTLSLAESAGGAPVSQGERRTFSKFFARLNNALAQRLIIGLGKDSGGLASCLLLGRWENLTGTVSRDFRALGILHLLAISGEHLSVLLGGLELLLRGFNKYIRFSVLAAGALLILALTGMSASVARAAFMSVLYYGAFLLRRRADSPTSLFAATAFILAVNPAAAADLGLVMSFGSTLGIITLGNSFAKQSKLRSGTAGFVRVNLINSLCAAVFTLPAAWLICGQLALSSPLSTLLFTLPFTALLYITPLALIFFGTPLFAPLGIAADALCGLTAGAAKKLGPLLSGTVISLRYPFVWVAFAAAAAAVILIPRLKPRFSGQAGFFAALAVFAAVFGVSLGVYNAANGGAARILYTNRGKNDMLAMRAGGMTFVCDISDGSYSPLKNAARLATEKLYTTDIEGFMLTHLHRRHVTQFSRLASRYFIRTLVLPSPQTEGERLVARSLEAAAREYGTDVRYYDASACGEVRMAGLTLTLPERLYIKRSTHPVITLKISGGATDLLYLGGGADETESLDRFILLDSWARGAEGIIFGAHSPVIKRPLAFYGYGALELAVYPTEAVKAAAAIKEPEGAASVVMETRGIKSVEFRLKTAN